MSWYDNIPVLGNILGGNSNNSGGLLGMTLNASGITQIVEEGVILFIGVTIALKLIDKL